MNFLANQKLARVVAAAAAAQTTLTSDVIDMLGYDGVTFVVLLGDVAAGSVLALQAQQGDAADGSDAADIAGVVANFTAGAADADNNMLAVEVFRPTKRFVRVTLARGTANAVVDGILAIQSEPNEAPTAQHASLIASNFALSPT